MTEWTTYAHAEVGRSESKDSFSESGVRDTATLRLQRLLTAQCRKNSIGLWVLVASMNAVSILILMQSIVR